MAVRGGTGEREVNARPTFGAEVVGSGPSAGPRPGDVLEPQVAVGATLPAHVGPGAVGAELPGQGVVGQR